MLLRPNALSPCEMAWLLDALGESTLEKLSQHLLDHIPPYASEALVESLVEESEPRVVEAQQVKNGGVEIGNVGALLNSSEAEFVGCADGLAAFDTSA